MTVPGPVFPRHLCHTSQSVSHSRMRGSARGRSQRCAPWVHGNSAGRRRHHVERAHTFPAKRYACARRRESPSRHSCHASLSRSSQRDRRARSVPGLPRTRRSVGIMTHLAPSPPLPVPATGRHQGTLPADSFDAADAIGQESAWRTGTGIGARNGRWHSTGRLRPPLP